MQTVLGGYRAEDETDGAVSTRSAGRPTKAALVGGAVRPAVGGVVGLLVGSARVHMRRMSKYFWATTSWLKKDLMQFG